MNMVKSAVEKRLSRSLFAVHNCSYVQMKFDLEPECFANLENRNGENMTEIVFLLDRINATP